MKSSKSGLEEALAFQIKAIGLPEPTREYRFHSTRKWRFDFAWPDQLIAMEVEGGVWNGGRHGRGSGIVKDIEKGNAAVLLGWQMLRATGDMVKSGEAVKLLEEYFNSEEVK